MSTIITELKPLYLGNLYISIHPGEENLRLFAVVIKILLYK